VNSRAFIKHASMLLLMGVFTSGSSALAQQPAPAAPTQSQPAPKRPPQAKSQQEYKDYNDAYALSGGAKMEEAANAFAAKYPTSELRGYLYLKTLHEYQGEDNAGKMLTVGEKVLALDPDNSIALVLTATVMADSLSDADQDREQKIAEIQKNSTHALQTVDTGFTPPAGATAEQVAAYKSTLQSMAHSALGIMELKTGRDPEAEKDLRVAADLNKAQPDPYIWYHLALAQDHQKKYSEALASVNQALQDRNIGSNAELRELAQHEQQRLKELAGPSANTPH
jgi:tetratricopeptide (TPR) repeat protein